MIPQPLTCTRLTHTHTRTRPADASPPYTAEDVRLAPNPFSWSEAASVLYIDSPAGTGLSYSQDKSDYFTNDTQTIDDLAVFLDSWFDLFPDFADQDLYIAGACWTQRAGRGLRWG